MRFALAPAQLGEALRRVLTPGPFEASPILNPRVGTLVLEDLFKATHWERRRQLQELAARHSAASSPVHLGVAIPPQLWDRFLERAGQRLTAGHRRWGLGAEEEGLVHLGFDRGPSVEWWGLSAWPGGMYDDRLWAWGAARENAGPRRLGLGGISPRLAWRSVEERWLAHPLLRAATSGMARPPRLAEGPGVLLAAIVDAVLELVSGVPLTGRDRAVIWGTQLLPILAQTRLLGPEEEHAGVAQMLGDQPPDYLMTLPYYLMHPRIQTALHALDRLCTLVLSEQWGDVSVACVEAGFPPTSQHPSDVGRAMASLLDALAASALHRRAADSWDSGFGFRLFRALLREVQASDSFAEAWDAFVQQDPAQAHAEGTLGALALRLQEALGTGLCFPGRPRYPSGPAAQQLLDMVWSRWTDPRFLQT